MNKDNLFWGVVFFNGSDLYFNAECWDGTGC